MSKAGPTWDADNKTMLKAAQQLRLEAPDDANHVDRMLADALEAQANAGTGYRGKIRTALVATARAYLGE